MDSASRQGRSAASGLPSLPGHLQGWLLKQVVGSATRAILDRSIPNIENAIDDEIARIASDHLERYTKARQVVTDRLHDGLF